MNMARTNQTLKISDLISPALMQALGPNTTNNFAAPKSRNTFKVKVEEVDPVRSKERVPSGSSRNSSHKLLHSTTVLDTARTDSPCDNSVAAA